MILSVAFLLICTSISNADLVSVVLGQEAGELGDNTIIAGQLIVGGENFITSGAVPAGVSFTITATSTGDGGLPNGQNGGLDNDFANSGTNPNFCDCNDLAKKLG